MRFLLVFIIFFSVHCNAQVRKFDKKIKSGTTLSTNKIDNTSVSRFSSMNLPANDSIKIKKIITKTGDTVAPIDQYKIFNEINGTSNFDTILNIKKQYQFNYLRKDLFGLLQFNNDGQTFQELNPNLLSVNNIINMGFNARRFSYLNKEDISYYRVPTPASELMYRSVTGKGQNLDALITMNVSEQLNFFLGYRGLRSQGRYVNQLTSNGNFRIGSSYFTKNKRYQFKNHITFQDISNEENGGLVFVNDFESSNEPFNNRETLRVQIADGKSLFKGLRGYFDHSFQINKSENNKALLRHQLTYEYFSNTYQQVNTNPFNSNTPYFGSSFASSIYDKVRHTRFENTFDLAFDSKKIGLFAISAGVYHFNHRYQSIVFDEFNNKIPNQLIDDIITVGGSYLLNKEKIVADASFKQSVVGRSLTDFKINAAFNLNENYGLQAYYRLESSIPDYTYQFFQSGYIGLNWLNDFSNEKISTLNAKIHSPWIDIEGTYQLTTDKLYFSNDALTLNQNGRFQQLLVSPKQYGKTINYFMIKGQKEFAFGKWALDNTVMFQQVIQEDAILNVPQIVTRNTVYFQDFAFKKALFFQTGITFNYFTKYYANEYHPVLGDFIVQNQVKVGNFPMFDFFLNAKIKTAQIYINIDHFNSMLTGYNYYNTPTYPYRDLTFRLGMKWNFFN
ncbi:putative porin [Flavobacterium sp. CBA20B-1]|uniref:putative porin n=1 Tax=unclassified Flavobacterium TaxID=196869 RepID=UPI00222492C1|nr:MULTISPECIES: putative porin [unclassified Flavobacterium]WCM43382.1 putative porin [Flavobacterium sp. CBA20B-1]